MYVRLSFSLFLCSSNSVLQDLQCPVDACRLLVPSAQRQPLADQTGKLPRIVALAIPVAVELVLELFRSGFEDVGFAVVLQRLPEIYQRATQTIGYGRSSRDESMEHIQEYCRRVSGAGFRS